MTLKYAERQARYYAKIAAELRQTSDASDAKKEKSERGKAPLEPPKGEKGKEKESTSTPVTRAREALPPVIDVHTPPSLDLLLAWTESRHYQDEDFTRNWFDLMTNEFYWIHPKSGEPINHWPAFYRACYLKHKENSSGKTAYRAKHADNFHAASEALRKEICDVLG